MKKIRVHLKERSYDILIGAGLLKKAGSYIKKLGIGGDAVVITNKEILRLYRRSLEASLKKCAFTVKFETVPDSEKAKSSPTALKLISRIAAYDRRRSLFIIAFGGGVVGDLAGFVAATYKRGIPYVQIPTTLLAEVDSAIGGKTAIDLNIAKNLVGAFYQPKLVISDISFIETLPVRQIRNGLAEIIKYAVIEDPRLFAFLEKNFNKILLGDRAALEYVIARSSAIKARAVEADEYDKTGVRAVLNFGHTVGHAIEAASSYSSGYNHGEAIAVGMIAACDMALKLKLIARRDEERIRSLIRRVGLPDRIKGLSLSKIYGALMHDKKFTAGRMRLVLPISIGRVKVAEGVGAKIVKDAVKKSSDQK